MDITLQYFDGCPNWTVAAERLAIIAAERGDLTVTRRLVESQEDAEAIGFRGSPSILVGGADLIPAPRSAWLAAGMSHRRGSLVHRRSTSCVGRCPLPELRNVSGRRLG